MARATAEVRARLAIFGHYDSRGGTAALEVESFDEAAAAAAKRRYLIDSWGIDPETADGAAEIANLASTADEDFLGFAELVADPEVVLEGDIDVCGWQPGGRMTLVLVRRPFEPGSDPGILEVVDLGPVPEGNLLDAQRDQHEAWGVEAGDYGGDGTPYSGPGSEWDSPRCTIRQHPRWDDDAMGFLMMG